MNQAVLTMAQSSRLVEPLIAGLTNQALFFSYGKKIPDLHEYNVTYWMGGMFALKLQRIGLATSLTSPGARWLPNIPKELAGRTILEGNLNDYLEYGQQAWVKPSEAKINSIPAGLYTPDEIKNKFSEGNFTHNISLQWTETIVPMNYEHRFFVADNTVITGSPYLVNGKGYSPHISYSRYEEAKKFAEHVLQETETPVAFTLDVALDENTNKWLVIEGNRAWSSGFYGSDPTAALEVAKLSCQTDKKKWIWQPDEHIVQLSYKEPLLKVVPLDRLDQQMDVFQYVQ